MEVSMSHKYTSKRSEHVGSRSRGTWKNASSLNKTICFERIRNYSMRPWTKTIMKLNHQIRLQRQKFGVISRQKN